MPAEPLTPGSSDDGAPGPGSALRRAVEQASQQVAQIIDAAEEEARRLREEAEREAQAAREAAEREAERRVAEVERRASVAAAELTERLELVLGRTKRMQVELEHLIAEVQSARDSASQALRLDAPAAGGDGGGPHPPLRDVSGPKPLQEAAGPREEALLRATQMAVAGSERSEIVAALRDELGIQDPEPVVAQVLGAR